MNSHGLKDGDVVLCIQNRLKSVGDFEFEIYLEKGKKYIVCEEGWIQTERKEIFLSDNDGDIRYILDDNFSDYFIKDIKETRKRKLKNINQDVK